MDSQSYSAADEDEHVEPAVVYQEEGGVYILFYFIILYLFFVVYILLMALALHACCHSLEEK